MEDRVKQLDHLILADTTLGPALFEQLREVQRELGLLQGNRVTCPFCGLILFLALSMKL
jgi:hypothetical protein